MMGSSLFDGVDEQQKAVSRAIQDWGEKLEKKMEHMREDFQKASDSNGRTLSQYGEVVTKLYGWLESQHNPLKRVKSNSSAGKSDGAKKEKTCGFLFQGSESKYFCIRLPLKIHRG